MFRHQLTTDTELRLLEPRHTAEIYAAVERNRAHLRRWLPWVDRVCGVDDIVAPSRNLAELAQHGHFSVGIWLRGQFVGMLAVHAIDWRNQQTSLGYWLAEDAQGQGIMTRACRTLLDHLFGELALHRVEIRAAAGNLRSRRVAERLGFRYEGTLRQAYWMADGPADDMVFGLLREEWQDGRERLAFSFPLDEDAELRLLLPYHAAEIFALIDRNRNHLRAWFPWPDATKNVDDIRIFVQRTIHASAEGSEIFWGIWYQGRYAGAISTLPIKWHAREAYLAYWLGDEFQGKGLVTMAGNTLLTYLFQTLNLNRVGIRYNPRNARSAAVAKRLGFTWEGTHRQAYWHFGTPEDVVYTSLLREEWEASHAG